MCTCNVGGHGVGGQAICTPYIRLNTQVRVELWRVFSRVASYFHGLKASLNTAFE